MKTQFLTTALAIATIAAAHAAPTKPNFILLLTDDQGWTDRTSVADPAYPDSRRNFFQTPNIDRLSRRSMNFTSGYAPAPVCTPTRRSIQFGMTPARIHGTEFKSEFDPAGHLTLPQMLKQADPAYICAHLGKWGEYHIGLASEFGDPRGEPKNLGYDISDGYTGNVHGTCDNKTKFKLLADEDPKRIFSMTKKGIGFLQKRAADKKPFYLQMSYYAIHRTPQARPEVIAKYKGKGDPRGGEYTLNLPPMLDELDTGIGQLLDELQKLGLADNTYIFFGSDNGGALPVKVPQDQPGVPNRNAPLAFGKGTIYEGGVRVPVMISGPGVPTNIFCHTPVVLYDVYATIHDLVGAKQPLPANIDAASLVEVMKKGDAAKLIRPTPGLVFHLPQRVHPHTSMRAGDYKIFIYWKDKNWTVQRIELFDLSKDIGEKNNIADQQPAKTKELADALIAYLKASNSEAPFCGRLQQSDER